MLTTYGTIKSWNFKIDPKSDFINPESLNPLALKSSESRFMPDHATYES